MKWLDGLFFENRLHACRTAKDVKGLVDEFEDKGKFAGEFLGKTMEYLSVMKEKEGFLDGNQYQRFLFQEVLCKIVKLSEYDSDVTMNALKTDISIYNSLVDNMEVLDVDVVSFVLEEISKVDEHKDNRLRIVNAITHNHGLENDMHDVILTEIRKFDGSENPELLESILANLIRDINMSNENERPHIESIKKLNDVFKVILNKSEEIGDVLITEDVTKQLFMLNIDNTPKAMEILEHANKIGDNNFIVGLVNSFLQPSIIEAKKEKEENNFTTIKKNAKNRKEAHIIGLYFEDESIDIELQNKLLHSIDDIDMLEQVSSVENIKPELIKCICSLVDSRYLEDLDYELGRIEEEYDYKNNVNKMEYDKYVRLLNVSKEYTQVINNLTERCKETFEYDEKIALDICNSIEGSEELIKFAFDEFSGNGEYSYRSGDRIECVKEAFIQSI